jgi:NAD(P)-dependent dehydrogenase (short-subunit alcohol dehydrogenase family)
MLENGEEGHIVNTASMAGLLTGANPYSISKHAVVCLTEGI